MIGSRQTQEIPISWKDSVQQLIALGREHHADATSRFVAQMAYQEFDDRAPPGGDLLAMTAAMLPTACRGQAENALRDARKHGASDEEIRAAVRAANEACDAQAGAEDAMWLDANGFAADVACIDGRSGDCC